VEAKFLDDKLLTYIGKIDPTVYFDRNKVANDEETQFLAYGLAYNPAFTSVFGMGYVPGIGAQYSLDDCIEGLTLGAAAISRDNSGDRIFDSLMAILEADYATDILGRDGNYRTYGYVAGLKATNASNDDDNFKESGFGFGFSADQYISERISLFGRCGLNSNDLAAGDWSRGTVLGAGDSVTRNPLIERTWSFGGQVENPLLDLGVDRPDDVFGAGFLVTRIYDIPYDNWYDDDDGEPSYGCKPFDEYLTELYYSIQLNPYIAVSPFIQFIKQIGGEPNRDNINTIMGARSHITF
jgi:hypothetical protein